MKVLKKVLFVFVMLFSFQTSFSKDEDFSKIKLKDINGVEYSFGKSNKETYVKLWASWCPVCIEGLEELDELSGETKDFEIVTVVFPRKLGEKNAEDFKKWYKSLGYKNIKVLLDEKGEILKLVNIRAFPTSVVLDKNGKAQKTILGHLEKAKIKKLFSSSMKMHNDMGKDKNMKDDSMMNNKDTEIQKKKMM